MVPFSYPIARLRRRHGPDGYADYESYRPWLRDEFVFRCIYCLKREQWSLRKAAYHLDHFDPQVRRPELTLNYDNLLYVCAACNTAKGDSELPDPGECLLADQIAIRADGSLVGLSADSRKIIGKLGLNSPDYREFRMLMIGVVQLAAAHDRALFTMLMRYPSDLPNLGALRPPSNTRPEGVGESFFARRARNELPETY